MKGTSSFFQRDLISIQDLTKSEIEEILTYSQEFKKRYPKDLLRGSILASCFFEPSTRTRLSFESAMLRLGGQVLGFADGQVTSAKKGESLKDTMRIISSYADVIVIRHPQEGSAKVAAIPVINGGDGAREHPTQTLLDLLSIQETQGSLTGGSFEGLNVAFVGDLKYGRTVHSLVLALSHYNCKLYFVSPSSLAMPEAILEELKVSNIQFSFHNSIQEIVDRVDVLYMTRVQEERFQDRSHYEKIKDEMVLKAELLKNVRPNFKVFHPLPRVQEINTDVDNTPHAYYFQQSENGLYVRMALLALFLGKV
jgi:aspartate carbamoyltransferase catalytic subunit